MMGAGVSSAWLLSCVLMTASLAAGVLAYTPAACSKGDTPCFCKAIGGTWKALQSPLLPACKVTYDHQGEERYVHVYLPPSYDGTSQWPIWLHLHGVFWATMGDIGARVGKPVNGTDIIPAFDHSVEILGDKAILVYPQSTGEAGMGTPDEGQGKKYRQFWRIPFWRCSVGICRDPSIDDMGFIEKVVADLPKRLPLKPKHYLLTGESAGGMMVHAILCESKVIPRYVDAAIDMLGGIGADYANGPKCAGSTPVPFLKLHGIEDPFITYSKQILVDGVNFASSIESTQLHARANGCTASDAGKKDVPEADGKMLCTDYCGGAASKPAAKLCGMPNVGHDTDHPHPGFVYEQSWAWFQEQVKVAASRNTSVLKPQGALATLANKTASSANVTKPKAPRTVQPLVLNITFPGVKLEDFKKGSKAGAAVAAVSKVTGLPAANITASYHSSSSSSKQTGSRRLLRLLLAAAAGGVEGGVTGRYALQAAQPSKVAQAVAGAVKDGSLLQVLQDKGLVSAGDAGQDGADAAGGPLVSLAAAGAAGAADKVLLKPTDLKQAAAQQAALDATPADEPEADTPSSSTPSDTAAAATASKPAGASELKATAAQGSAAATDSSSSSSLASTGLIIGAVLGAVGGAALLAAGISWATAAARKRKQQQQQQQQQEYSVEGKPWQQQQQQQQQQRPGVINLNADAAMLIAEEPKFQAK